MKETELVSIKNQLARAAAVGALGVLTMAGYEAPASASTAGMHATAAGARVAITRPNVNIQGSPAKWSPTKVTAPPTKGRCTAKNFSFSMRNKTATTKSILINTGSGKKPFAKIQAKKAIVVCGPAHSKAKFFIKGSKSVLSATIT
jgi:hypothetical protein